MLLWYVTGTFHGAHVYSVCEGDARRTFHQHYNGESIVHIRDSRTPLKPNELSPDPDEQR